MFTKRDRSKTVECQPDDLAGAAKQHWRIVMVGTHPMTRGGISTVVRGYMGGGLFDRVEGRYVVTHRDGNVREKALTAVTGFAQLARSLIGRGRPIVHIHLSSRASFWRKSVVCVIARFARCPYLLHVHGSEFIHFYDRECGPIAKRCVRTAFKHAELILALSSEWRADLERICPAATIRILHNAVAIPPERKVIGATSSPPRILALGRIGDRKGTFDLIRAFAQVLPRFRDCILVCAGDGEIARAAALAAELGIADSVQLPGWLSPEDTAAQLAAATIFALPSYAEGLPMALLEAMACGLAVVTTPVGGIPQVVQHHKNGLLVSPGDVPALAAEISRLLGEPNWRAHLGAAARATISQDFSLGAAIERLINLYASLGLVARRGSADVR